MKLTNRKILIVIMILLLAFFTLVNLGWYSVNQKVNNATTKEQLEKACANLSTQDAPVKCLELKGK